MNVVPVRDCPLSAATRWWLTEDALVEESAAGARLYGRWDRLFGCWSGERLVVPDHPMLDGRGVWLDPPGNRDDDWFASRAAIAAYFSLIPTPIRRLAAPFAERQWHVLEALWHDPSLARRLDAGQAIWLAGDEARRRWPPGV